MEVEEDRGIEGARCKVARWLTPYGQPMAIYPTTRLGTADFRDGWQQTSRSCAHGRWHNRRHGLRPDGWRRNGWRCL